LKELVVKGIIHLSFEIVVGIVLKDIEYIVKFELRVSGL